MRAIEDRYGTPCLGQLPSVIRPFIFPAQNNFARQLPLKDDTYILGNSCGLERITCDQSDTQQRWHAHRLASGNVVKLGYTTRQHAHRPGIRQEAVQDYNRRPRCVAFVDSLFIAPLMPASAAR
jgi:hypothetical protein